LQKIKAIEGIDRCRIGNHSYHIVINNYYLGGAIMNGQSKLNQINTN